MYEIETHVPLPLRKPRGGQARKYPFHVLQPGESFLVPGGKLRNVQSAASHAARSLGEAYRFYVAEVIGGVRAWRLPNPSALHPLEPPARVAVVDDHPPGSYRLPRVRMPR